MFVLGIYSFSSTSACRSSLDTAPRNNVGSDVQRRWGADGGGVERGADKGALVNITVLRNSSCNQTVKWGSEQCVHVSGGIIYKGAPAPTSIILVLFCTLHIIHTHTKYDYSLSAPLATQLGSST